MRLSCRKSRSFHRKWHRTQTQVQDLINDGKLNFEDLDRPTEVKGSSRINVEMMRQEKEIPKEANFGKAVIPTGKVPVDAPFCPGNFVRLNIVIC